MSGGAVLRLEELPKARLTEAHAAALVVGRVLLAPVARDQEPVRRAALHHLLDYHLVVNQAVAVGEVVSAPHLGRRDGAAGAGRVADQTFPVLLVIHLRENRRDGQGEQLRFDRALYVGRVPEDREPRLAPAFAPSEGARHQLERLPAVHEALYRSRLLERRQLLALEVFRD